MPSRSLSRHKVNGLNEAINIAVMDDPGSGGACHHYRVEPIVSSHPQGAINPFDVKFQNGPIGDNGVNGCSNESLLAIVEDRLAGFQSGKFACPENDLALGLVREAMDTLKQRTEQRMKRGVEGTLTV